MKMFKHSNLVYLTFFLFIYLHPLPKGFAQGKVEVVADSVKPTPETIALADISVRSGESEINAKKMMESLISAGEIALLKMTNDSLAAIIDSLIKVDRNIDLHSKNTRYLRNKEVLWNGIASKIEVKKSTLTVTIHDLDEKKYALEHEINVWKATREKLRKDEPASSVFSRIDGVIYKLDSAKNVIQGKSEKVIDVLDQTTIKSLAVNDLLTLIKNTVKEKESSIFVASQPPVWQTEFRNASNWNVFDPLLQFSKLELQELLRYFRKHIPIVVLQLILLILLFAAFQVIKSRIRKTAINENSFYQRMLVRVLSNPISAALILGMFSTFVVFPDRPMIFEEVSRFIVMIPLIIIVTNLTTDEYNKYIYALGILMLIQMGSFIFPPGHLFYMFSLLALALTEIGILGMLFRRFQNHPFKQKPWSRLILFIILLHLGFSVAGFIGILSGAFMLSEIALNVPIMNAFAGVFLVISAMIINGLMEVAVESRAVQKVNVFRLYGSYIEQRITRLINLGAVVTWVLTALQVIKIINPVIDGITGFFTGNINIGSASFTLWGIVIFFLVIWLSLVISKILRIALEEDILDKFNLAKGVPHTISVLISYALVTIGLILAVRAAGMPTDKLTILFGAFGVGIGFGLQNIFNNLVSGLILLFERPIQIGDTIEVGKLTGNVKSIGIRSSHIHTFDGAEVIVPNGNLISNEVVNWTLSDETRRIEVLAGVAYGSDPHKVKMLFEKILNDHPDIIKDPPPSVFFQNLGESSLDFRLLFWTNNFSEWIRIRSDIIFAVHDILKQEGIEIPFPQRDLHLRSVDQHIEIVRKEIKT